MTSVGTGSCNAFVRKLARRGRAVDLSPGMRSLSSLLRSAPVDIPVGKLLGHCLFPRAAFLLRLYKELAPVLFSS